MSEKFFVRKRWKSNGMSFDAKWGIRFLNNTHILDDESIGSFCICDDDDNIVARVEDGEMVKYTPIVVEKSGKIAGDEKKKKNE